MLLAQVMPYSTGLSTPLANFEANQNYKDTMDPSVMVGTTSWESCSSQKLLLWKHAQLLRWCCAAQVAFSIENDVDNACFIAWTTTPWYV